MSFVNQSANFYNSETAIRVSLSFAASGAFAINPKVRVQHIRAALAFESTARFFVNPQTRSPRSLNFRARFSGSITPNQALSLSMPDPILNQISATAFDNQRYLPPRLLINNVETPFVRAVISAPRKSLGKSISVDVARADLGQLPENANIKFQIGRRVNGVPFWTTILENGKLSGWNYSMTRERDSLSFSTVEGLSDKLGKCPRHNLIVYDVNKMTVSTEEIAPVPIDGGGVIRTDKRGFSVLTLYTLLQIAFVEGCGFSSVKTEIPNFEIKRCNFSVNQSYTDALSQFTGYYEPVFVERAGALEIIATNKKLPQNFAPRRLSADKYPNFSKSTGGEIARIDGYTLQYLGVPGQIYADRDLPEQTDRSSGDIEMKVKRRIREWFNESGVVVKTETKKEIRETRSFFLTQSEETVNNFDRQGRATGYTKTFYARMPDIGSDGVPSLMKTREEVQRITYATNPFAPLRTIQSKIETKISGLLAVDDELTALDSEGNETPYKQDYEKVFENGQLKKEMRKDFAPLELTTERFRPLADGQVEYRSEHFDYLRGKPRPAFSANRSGDVSVSETERPQNLVILKQGIDADTRTKPVPVFAVGELPLRFAKPLVSDILAAGDRVSGNIEIAGFDESVERGVLFNLRGRAGADEGNFLTLGYKIVITPTSITTTLDSLKIPNG